MTIRFQADADLNQDIVTGVLRRQPAIDFQTAADAELSGLPDLAVLQIAAAQSRILVTHDRKTMPRYFAEFITTSTSSGLLIISKKLVIDVAIENLVILWAASNSEEWENRIAALPL